MTVKANIHDAKTNLSRLIEQALAGEEVVIAKAGKPLVKLVPVDEAAELARPGLLGSMRGEIWYAPDYDKADGEIEALFYGEDPARSRGVAEE